MKQNKNATKQTRESTPGKATDNAPTTKKQILHPCISSDPHSKLEYEWETPCPSTRNVNTRSTVTTTKKRQRRQHQQRQTQRLIPPSVACCDMLLSCLSVCVCVVFASVGAISVYLGMSVGSLASYFLCSQILLLGARARLTTRLLNKLKVSK